MSFRVKNTPVRKYDRHFKNLDEPSKSCWERLAKLGLCQNKKKKFSNFLSFPF